MRSLKQANSWNLALTSKSHQWQGKGGNEKLLFNAHRVSVWDDERVLEMDSENIHEKKTLIK